MERNELGNKIQLVSNRIRCSGCYAGFEDMVITVSDDLRFRRSFIRSGLKKPCFFSSTKNHSLRISRAQELESIDVLVMICLRCGYSRRVLVLKNPLDI